MNALDEFKHFVEESGSDSKTLYSVIGIILVLDINTKQKAFMNHSLMAALKTTLTLKMKITTYKTKKEKRLNVQ